MIQTAARLFQRDGYTATSWRGLVDAAGTPWGSIHHHFPGGKEELGVAATDAGAEAVAALIEYCFDEDPDPASALTRWFQLSADLLVNSEYAAGCPVATVALETAATSRPMKKASCRAFNRWQELIAARLRGAGATPSDAREAAEVVLALLEGGLLLARVRATRRPMQAASRQAQSLVRGVLSVDGTA
jgi:TetR/AcrR family transcriptional regulator, lmrAB and yxaGH operons repressor